MNKSTMFFVSKVVLVLVIGLGGFHLGRTVGEDSTRKRAEKETYLLSSLNAVPLYAGYAEMSERIMDGKLNQAKCAANINASSYLRTVKRCLEERVCRDFISDEVKKIAPELLDEGRQKFTYYESGESCLYENPDKSKGIKK